MMYRTTIDSAAYRNLLEKIRKHSAIMGLYHVWGVPKSGAVVAQDLIAHSQQTPGPTLSIGGFHREDLLIIDDVLDSGETLKQFLGRPTAVVVSKNQEFASKNCVFSAMDCPKDTWVEIEDLSSSSSSDERQIVRRMIQRMGDNPNREGLIETPDRVVKAWDHWFGGYREKPEDVIKCFRDDSSDELVILKDIEFYSHCEHHLTPFYGKAHVGYLPDGKILGASKLARIVDLYSRRLQIQERIANQVVCILDEYVEPLGSFCYIEAKHLCVSSRGVAKQESVFVTSALSGVFKKDPAARAELFALLK